MADCAIKKTGCDHKLIVKNQLGRKFKSCWHQAKAVILLSVENNLSREFCWKFRKYIC